MEPSGRNQWQPVANGMRQLVAIHGNGLRMSEPPVRVRAPHVNDTGGAVDVAPLEPEPLRRPQPGRRGEDDHRAVHPAESRGDGF
jgi:hypothetical protein